MDQLTDINLIPSFLDVHPSVKTSELVQPGTNERIRFARKATEVS